MEGDSQMEDYKDGTSSLGEEARADGDAHLCGLCRREEVSLTLCDTVEIPKR